MENLMTETNVSKTLVIVESPKKARTIGKYLGEEYIVLASYGHIYDLVSNKKFPWGIDIQHEFKPHYGIISDKKDVLTAIIKASTLADQIFLASDNDREGAAIAFHLASALESTGKPIKRIVFNEITKKEIEKAIKNPLDLDPNLFDSQQGRRVLDRIVGYAVSPYLKDAEQSYTAGRVQSVALKLIVDRDHDINKFISRDYWTIQGTGTFDNELVEVRYTSTLDNESDANKVLDVLKNQNLTVRNIRSETKIKPAPAPFTTLTLVGAAHSQLGFAAAKTMQCAQSLYESGFITYMRTDSTRASDDSIKDARKVLKDSGLPFPKKPNIYDVGKGAQNAHECIRPSNFAIDPDTIFVDVNAQKIYKLIWNRFLASQMIPAEYYTSTIDFSTPSGYSFIAKGRSVKELGWIKLIPSAEDKTNKIPSFKINDQLKIDEASSKKKKTQPPSRFNERTLIEDLESKGIGRPSTYATIIPKILERGYAIEENHTYVSTPIGEKLISKLEPYFSFMRYEYTAKMEENLDKIAEGKDTYTDMITNFYKKFQSELSNAYANTKNKSTIKCKLCKSNTEQFVKDDITYVHCMHYPACDFKLRFKEFEGKQVDINDDCPSCKKCGFFTFLKTNNNGNFWACPRFPRCT